MKTTKITENFLPKQAIGKLLVTCQFTTKSRDYESKAEDYICDNKDDVLDSGQCKFHDENYLQDKNKHKEREHEVVTKLMVKVNKSKDRKEALLCIGYHLPDNITVKGKFSKPVYFLQAKFQRIDFSLAKFSETSFGNAKFSGEAGFDPQFNDGQQSTNNQQQSLGSSNLQTTGNTATPKFVAPILRYDTMLAFSLNVMDSDGGQLTLIQLSCML